MSRGQEGRVRKAEARRRSPADDRIPVYVEDEEDLHTRIAELIAAGAPSEAERPRCVFWLDYRHYSEWQREDEASQQLDAQAEIDTPCAKWLREDDGEACEPDAHERNGSTRKSRVSGAAAVASRCY